MDKKNLYGTNENREYLRTLGDELIKFGRSFASPGGGSYYLGDDGTPWKDRPRETWITSRMAHVYSMAHILGYEGADKLAEAAITGLRGELHDDINGGWYAGLSADGTPLQGKACYAHAFVILAATSGKLAGIKGAEELLAEALKTYDERFWDEAEGLAADTWNTEFTHLDSYRGLNANMHSVEAFLAVADVTGDDTYRVRAGRIIDRVLAWAKDNNWRIPEHYSDSWVPDLECNKDHPADQFKPYGATPGHGIEWSRLITQWALSVDRPEYIDSAKELYNRAILDAWNADGAPGVVYTTDWEGKPIVRDRMHWTLAEAINASATLFKATGDERYANDYAAFMEYLEDKVHDKVNGSWYHQLNEHNEVIGTVWPGKSDLYHAYQATLIPYSDIKVSVAVSL